MRIGIKFPSREIGTDRGVIRDWVLALADTGFTHVVVADHVLGVDAAAHPGYDAQFPSTGKRAPYKVSDEFHEPLIALGFITALATQVELSTGVVIGPQRQTALLAKQVAELDLLAGGNMRLVLGTGWNPIEYRALQVDFRTRGARMEAQIAALRALWTEETVHQVNEFEDITGVGLAPNAVQRPVPVWLGGWAPVALERVGRLADGWYYGHDFPPHLADDLGIIARAAESAGRDPDAIGLEGAVEMRDGLDGMDARAAEWERLGASHLVIDPQMGGFAGAEHIDVLQRIAARVGVAKSA